MAELDEVLAELKNIRREAAILRQLVGEALAALREAETEVPESMRRFITYMHDLHDVCYMYESRGQPAPRHVTEEMERCDDRYRQLLKKHNTDGGTFEKVRREMAKDSENRWDHTRLLTKPEGTKDEL